MGNKHSQYSNIPDLSDEYEQFADYILTTVMNIKYGCRGFTKPFKITNKIFDRKFIYKSPKDFDPFEQNSWEQLMVALNNKCDADYTFNTDYNDKFWTININKIDKKWNLMDKAANYILIHCKEVLWANQGVPEEVVISLPDTVSSYSWFDVHNPEHVKELFESISKVSQLRSVTYKLKLLQLSSDNFHVSYPEEVEGQK